MHSQLMDPQTFPFYRVKKDKFNFQNVCYNMIHFAIKILKNMKIVFVFLKVEATKISGTNCYNKNLMQTTFYQVQKEIIALNKAKTGWVRTVHYY